MTTSPSSTWKGKADAKLTVYPDKSAPGSEGRLCLQLDPERFPYLKERTFECVGNFKRLGAVMLVEHPEGNSITPRFQYWWKNGVRDHGIRQNWLCSVDMVTTSIAVVVLVEPTEEPPPELPPSQVFLFE